MANSIYFIFSWINIISSQIILSQRLFNIPFFSFIAVINHAFVKSQPQILISLEVQNTVNELKRPAINIYPSFVIAKQKDFMANKYPFKPSKIGIPHNKSFEYFLCLFKKARMCQVYFDVSLSVIITDTAGMFQR